jgi:ABC-2 type transport system ATP-binding protein
MPDLAPIISDLKVWEFLDLFAAAYGISVAERPKRVNECLDLVKMSGSRNALCGTLSRGMTQRVVLAKTLLHKPEILLLDEPASGMDPIARIDMKDALQAVAAEGATIIISSHILSELAEMATSIGILHKGKLRQHGSVHTVLASMEQTISTVQIDLIDRIADCRRWLEQKNLQAISANGREDRLVIEIEGGRPAQAALLSDLISAGFAIHGYQAKASSLEDVMRAISTEPEDNT